MGNLAGTDLEGCIRELAKRVRHDLVGKTPFEVDEYFLCRSIEHLVRVGGRNVPAVVTHMESYRRRGEADRPCAKFGFEPSAQETMLFPRFRR